MFDWFFKLFDKLTQSVVWDTLLSHFQWVDWFAGIFLIIGILYGLKNGLIAEIGEILELTIVIFIVHDQYGQLVHLMTKYMDYIPAVYRPPTAFVVTAAPVFSLVHFIFTQLKKLIHADVIKPLKYIGGVLLGAVHLLLFYSFLVQAILLIPSHDLKKSLDKGNSYTGEYIAKLSPAVYEIFKHPFE